MIAAGVGATCRAARIGLVLAGLFPAAAGAQGHGPIYGLSTPTLGRGEWSTDMALMARFVSGGTAVMARPMVSYGATEDLQLSVSIPVPIHRMEGLRPVRGLTRMPMTTDMVGMIGWRFHRNAPSVGTRWESTVWTALEWPLDDQRAGIPTAPGLYGAVVTGYASRSWYVWGGGAWRRPMADRGTDVARPGDTKLASLVVGYRPAAFRADYPSPDWRGFLELVGEWTGSATTMDGTPAGMTAAAGGRQIFLGLTVLGLYGSWGVSGGPAFPLYQESDGGSGAAFRERLRLAVNLTFWF